jgi:hypothetical protein
VDIQSVTEANQSLVSQISRNNNESIGESAEYRRFTQDLNAFSSVSGLIGVEKEFWIAGNGTVYANVRMNRAECSARYQRAIEANEHLIDLATDKADAAAGSFEALANLRFARTVAELTDNLYAIRSVLQPQSAGQRPQYGGAGEIGLLHQEASRLIVVEVRVRGDVDGRMAKAFSAVFSERGYRTSEAGREAPYILGADFTLEDSEQTDTRYRYARITLKGVLANRRGEELLAFSEDRREGHLLREEARRRAVQRAEGFIAGEGFGGKFDAYLDSLL